MRKTLLLMFVMLFVAAFASADIDYKKEAEDVVVATPANPVIDEFGGPDAWGYIYRDSDEPDGPIYSWVDITGTGTDITGSLSDDSIVGPYPIGFSFPYYGTSYTDFWVNSNGTIVFDGTYISLSNYQMPTVSPDSPFIAWFWDDLDPANGADGQVFYETMMIGPNNALVIEFYQYDEYPNGPDAPNVTAEVILFDDGRIIMQYSEFTGAFDFAGGTIGIQSNAATGLGVLYNGSIPNYPFPNLAIEYLVLPGDADVTGTITDAVTGDAIPGVTVTILNHTVQTDALGVYEILGAFSGDMTINITMDGYDPIEQLVMLDPGPNTYDFMLTPQYLLDIEPLSGTTVPPNGGVVRYSAQLTNPTPFASLMDGWTYVGLPDGMNYYGPLVLIPLNLQSGTVTIPQLGLQVPGMAPSGLYTFHAAIGIFPNGALSEDMFYFWKLGPGVGEGEWSDTPWDAALAGTLDDIVLPVTYEVAKVYPNPFNPTATVEITLPDAADLQVRVYNVTGQMVAELANGSYHAGSHNLTIDGSALASGIYFVHTQVPDQINDIQKITLLK